MMEFKEIDFPFEHWSLDVLDITFECMGDLMEVNSASIHRCDFPSSATGQ
jgi:hypothetical protein